ncbi:hypothetical protein [Photobacterium ganghwense]|uniref:hypothetical protein n=1 Tax=Photobacterium ganghwense TaxID=320778 RepID=UPI001A8F53F1|nr:hypothetical protein [Photobacterium ganghwense]QSV17335.1 hypothetical protein FH974_20640 [Photobacterium ganghwense]
MDITLNYDDAYDFYRRYIYQPDLFEELRLYNFNVSGTVHPTYWEMFCSKLTGRRGRDGYGADLDGFEVKSAKEGSNFEYQYHLNTGLDKLYDDCKISHLYCSYSQDYSRVTVFKLEPSQVSDTFMTWMPLYQENYSIKDPKQRKQRFRRSMSYRFVVSNGTLILEIVDGELQYTSG